MIIATAGHVDHGKTTLLQAITGVNADRLPEEKKRGMTIDLGYAYWPQPDGRVPGFIDVPGHEKFLSNMLAGVGGIDHALLVVACDDGVMAQTREHLAILQLTGNPMLTVALTKADRVDEARVNEVERQVKEVLREYGFAEAKLFITAATEGRGMDALREHLLRDFTIAVVALGLVDRALVVLEVEPRHAVQDRLHRLGGRTRNIGVLDP